MSSDYAIRVQGLGKRYAIYDRPHHRLMEIFGSRPRAREFWALRGLDLEIFRGETVGVLGRNGSGKSTLLQMICGTLQPTEGRIEVNGRVAALLELGAGFNPEFTGRENVFLNASLLGMSRAQTEGCLAEILQFADIGDFIDQPVRTYSSGMFIRLAFAIAVSAQPEVLVVDEALAVGDEAFQRKCFARIEDMKRAGATILLVSHSAGAILQLCDRAVLLDHGRRLLTGAPKAAVASYQRLVYAPADRQDEIVRQILAEDAAGGVADDALADGYAMPVSAGEPVVEQHDVLTTERFDHGMRPDSTVEYASHGARISRARITTEGGREVNVLAPDQRYIYTYDVAFERAAKHVHFGMMIRSITGIELFGMASHAHGDAIESIPAGATVRVSFGIRASMLPGAYFINAGCMGSVDGGGETFLHRILDAVMFRVELPRTDRRLSGFFDISEEPACAWQTVV